MQEPGKSKGNWLENLEKIQDGAQKNYFSVLPQEKELLNYFSDAFVLNKPKGRVGGDGFWLHTNGANDVFLALFTCVGDGHLASMMIRIYMDALRKMVEGYSIEFPGSILQFLHREVQAKFKGKNNILLSTNANVGIVKVNTESKEIEFAGANMDLMQVRREGVKTIDGVGKQVGETAEKMVSYPSIELANVDDSSFYLCSTGLFNLIGGSEMKKLDSEKLGGFWRERRPMPMEDQKKETDKLISNWTGVSGQNDDVMVIGFKL